MRRGEVWWAELPEPPGRRPVVLLSRRDAYAIRALITVAPVTTRVRGLPVEVLLRPEDGMPRLCVANLDSITTIPKDLLRTRAATLSPDRMRDIEAAIRFALGMER